MAQSPYKTTIKQNKPHYTNHRKRLRERFRKASADGFHDYELLELLLTYAVPRKDVKPISKLMIERFGGLSGVINSSQAELEAIPGVGSRSALLIQLVREICGAYLAERMKKRNALASPQLVVDFARMKLAGLPNETFMVIFLNVKNEVINYSIVHEGTVDRAVIYPRRIVELALAQHAAGIILVHNHPSGHPKPSVEDREITRKISKAASTMDIQVLDHIVIGGDGYFSLAETGEL